MIFGKLKKNANSVVTVQQKNVLKAIVHQANIYAENLKTADMPMGHIVVCMVNGHITKLVPTNVTSLLENVKPNVLQANTLAPMKNQCFAKMDFGKETNIALTDAILQQENVNRLNALQGNINAPITIQCSVKMDFGKMTNPALMDATNQQENVKLVIKYK